MLDNFNHTKMAKEIYNEYVNAVDNKDFERAKKLNQAFYIITYNELQELKNHKLSLLKKEKPSVSNIDLLSLNNRSINNTIKLLDALLESGILMSFGSYWFTGEENVR